jgi:hypothetical protein
MSTKIYRAWRYEKGHLIWPFIRHVRAKAFETTRECIKAVYADFQKNVKKDSPVYTSYLEKYQGNEAVALVMIAREGIRSTYMPQGLGSPALVDLDVSLTIREYEKQLYLIPYTGTHAQGAFDFLDDEVGVHDFSYWNSSDKPEDLSDEEWERRKVTWDAIGLDPPEWRDYLSLDICDRESWWQLDPLQELLQAARESSNGAGKIEVVSG